MSCVANNTDKLSVDPACIAIGGISAGAGLAAGLTLYVRDKTDIQLAFQLLRCPMIDDRCVTASGHMITDKRVWNRDSNLSGWKTICMGVKILSNSPIKLYPNMLPPVAQPV